MKVPNSINGNLRKKLALKRVSTSDIIDGQYLRINEYFLIK